MQTHAAETDSRAHRVRLPLSDLRLMNYFPAANGWTYMWTRFDAAAIDSDFARIAALGFNAVRVNVLVSAFALPVPAQIDLEHLAQVIHTAERHGLQVQLGLFDWLPNFTTIESSKRWAEAVVSPYKNDTRIAFIDVLNEMDTSNPEQLAWAQAIVPHVRHLAGSIPVTVSVTAKSGRSVTQHLQALLDSGVTLDFADVHLYGNAATAYSKLQGVLQLTGALPVFVGETGYSSYSAYRPDAPGSSLFGVPPNDEATEAMQAYQLRTLSHTVAALKLPAIAPWSYSDFKEGAIPPSHVGSNPWEYHFGLLHTDQAEKPAARFMRSLNSGASLADDFNNGFEEVDAHGLPLLWRLYSRPCSSFPAAACGYEADFGTDTKVVRTGRVSARTSNAVSNAHGTPAFYLSPPTPALPGHAYSFSAYARGKDVSGIARISVSWYTESGCFVGNAPSASLPPGDSSWSRLSVNMTLPASGSADHCGGAAPAYVELRLESGSPRGTVWFDDVEFGPH